MLYRRVGPRKDLRPLRGPRSWRGTLGPIERDASFIVSESDIAYLAGILDGEGTVSWQKSSDTLLLCVTNTHEGLIDWLVARCGGSKHREVVSPDRRGDTSRWRPKWRWTLTGYRASFVLEATLPHMMVKRERGEAALIRWRDSEPQRLQGPRSKAISQLAADGWPVRA